MCVCDRKKHIRNAYGFNRASWNESENTQPSRRRHSDNTTAGISYTFVIAFTHIKFKYAYLCIYIFFASNCGSFQRNISFFGACATASPVILGTTTTVAYAGELSVLDSVRPSVALSCARPTQVLGNITNLIYFARRCCATSFWLWLVCASAFAQIHTFGGPMSRLSQPKIGTLWFHSLRTKNQTSDVRAHVTSVNGLIFFFTTPTSACIILCINMCVCVSDRRRGILPTRHTYTLAREHYARARVHDIITSEFR